VLCEYRTTMGGQVRGVLADHGWEHQACSDPPEGRNGLLVASRLVMERIPEVGTGVEQRLIGVRLGESGMVVLGAHVPPLEAEDGEAQSVWRALLGSARAHATGRTLVIGDLNAGRRWRDEAGAGGSRRLSREAPALRRVGTESMGRLWLMGYRDAWRDGAGRGGAHDDDAEGPGERVGKSSGEREFAREFSWFSHEGRGVRIDHALASSALSGAVRGAWYEHGVRESGVSDHAAMIVDIS